MKRVLAGSLLVFFLVLDAWGQTTAFTYQGSLSVGGVPANGNFDFQFVLYNVPSGGIPVGIGLAVNNLAVSNGSFTVVLNFQNQFPGTERYLEIRVRPAGQGSHTTLTPRQIFTSTPYAIKSINAEQLGGVASNQFVLTTDSRLTDARSPLPNSGNYIQNRTTTQTASNFNVSGNGTVGGSLTAGENSFFEKTVSVGTTLNVGGSTTVGTSLTVGSNVNAGAVSTTGGVTVGTILNAGAVSTTGAVTVGSTLNAGAITTTGGATIGTTLNAGTINTGTQFNVGGHFALGRSRLDLFNTAVVPDGYSFQVLNSPNFLVLRNDAGSTLMTIARDGKVGIGDNNPAEATLEIGGTIAVSNLGGNDGDHLCKAPGNLIRACGATLHDSEKSDVREQLARLESLVERQQFEIEKQKKEIAKLRQLVCTRTVEACPE